LKLGTSDFPPPTFPVWDGLFGRAFSKTSREEVFGLKGGYIAWFQGIFGHFGGLCWMESGSLAVYSSWKMKMNPSKEDSYSI